VLSVVGRFPFGVCVGICFRSDFVVVSSLLDVCFCVVSMLVSSFGCWFSARFGGCSPYK
jgi:hypothetical protein